MKEGKPKVLIVIVAFNEEKSIEKLVGEIRSEVKQDAFHWDAVVVDDGSTDRTAAAAAGAGVKVLRHPVNLGIGAAEQTGLLYAGKCGYDIVVRVDGDGQHPPECIAELVRATAGGGAHMAIGSRFVEGDTGGSKSTVPRRIGIMYFSILCRLLSGRTVKDPTSGFRCFGRAGIDLFSRLPAPDFPEIESFIEAARSGMNIVEVPAPFRPRGGGESSIKMHHSAYYMVKVTMAILVASMRKKTRLLEEENDR